MYPGYFWTSPSHWHTVMGRGRKSKARVTAKEPASCDHLFPFTSTEKKITKEEQVKSGADWNIFFQEKMIAKAHRSE